MKTWRSIPFCFAKLLANRSSNHLQRIVPSEMTKYMIQSRFEILKNGGSSMSSSFFWLCKFLTSISSMKRSYEVMTRLSNSSWDVDVWANNLKRVTKLRFCLWNSISSVGMPFGKLSSKQCWTASETDEISSRE